MLAQPTDKKGAAQVANRLREWQTHYEDLMLFKTKEEREKEKAARVKSSWDMIRGATKKIKEALTTKPGVFTIDYEAIERKRKRWPGNSKQGR